MRSLAASRLVLAMIFSLPAALEQTTVLAQEDSPRQRAECATVQLTLDHADGQAIFSGTIIARQGGEALVLTCGHPFKAFEGVDELTVSLEGLADSPTMAGRLIHCDAGDRDIALVTFRPMSPVKPVRLASRRWSAAVGTEVFYCLHSDEGELQAKQTVVTCIDRYLGPANVEVEGAAPLGRGGTGLFNARGRLIGLCMAVDPSDDETIFEAVSSVRAYFAEVIRENDELAAWKIPGHFSKSQSVRGPEARRLQQRVRELSSEIEQLRARIEGLERCRKAASDNTLDR